MESQQPIEHPATPILIGVLVLVVPLTMLTTKSRPLAAVGLISMVSGGVLFKKWVTA